MTVETVSEPSVPQSVFRTAIAPVLTVEGLRHELINNNGEVGYAVQVDKLILPLGGFIGLLGPNACGKTTLLTLLGLLQKPECADSHNSDGVSALKTSLLRVLSLLWKPASRTRHQGDGVSALESFKLIEYGDVAGAGAPARVHNLAKLWADDSNSRIEQLRRRLVGFALQTGELLPNLSVIQNVEMPLRLNGKSRREARKTAQELLETLGNPQATHAEEEDVRYGFPAAGRKNDLRRVEQSLPGQLAGSQYQRVAIARGIAHEPQIVFVDEPTNNLARGTACRALEALRNRRERGMTVVMITHDVVLADRFCDFVVCMDSWDGREGYVNAFYRKEATARWWQVEADWRRCKAGPFETIPSSWNSGDEKATEEDEPAFRRRPR